MYIHIVQLSLINMQAYIHTDKYILKYDRLM